MDTILLLSPEEQKLEKFLSKLGYEVFHQNSEVPLKELVDGKVLDLIILDTSLRDDAIDLCEFLRANDTTKTVPIICLGGDRLTAVKIKEFAHDKIEIIPAPWSVGPLVAKIATQLRLRKMAGQKGNSATLAETNAALRDMNKRLKQEREHARAIQVSLLPESLPKNEKFEIAVSYSPLEEVGGDWYFFRLKNDRLEAQIADVTGHGLAAAFVGCMTKLALTASNKSEPAELLEETNRLIAPHLPPGNFITICGWVYEADTGRIKFANGGHPPALVLNRGEDKITELKGSGFALGFLDDAKYTEAEAKLEKGDILAAYTDGITEALNRNGEQYGVARLSAVLKSSTPDMSAGEVKDVILNDLKEFCDGRILKDDITLILLRSI